MAYGTTAYESRRVLSELRLVSIVEALSVTGPLKPLIEFSSLARAGIQDSPPLRHFLISTRRPQGAASAATDPLRVAAEKSGLTFLPIPEKRAFDLGVLARFHEAIAACRPQIIETHDSKSHFLLFLLRILHPEVRRPKWIAFHHGYTRTSLRVRLYQQLDRMSLRQADRVVTLCAPFAADLCRRGVQHRNITIIKNFVAPRATPTDEATALTRRELRIAPEECLILSVGRLSSEKAHSDLIVAFGQARERAPTVRSRLVLAGDGPERARLEQLAAPMGSQVIFCGHLADPWTLMNAADIFVLPSHSEGSPLVIFEAMAAHLPIVATSVGGIPETLNNEVNALLVPPMEPAALAGALLRLLADAELRSTLRAAAGREVASFSPAAYAGRLLNVYRQVLRT